MGLFDKVFGSHSDKELKRISKTVDKIEALDESMQKLSDEELRHKTVEFKERLANGETLDDLLPEAYASKRSQQPCDRFKTLPCTADRWYHPASGTYRRDENW